MGPGPWVGHGRRMHEGSGMGWGGWVVWILLTVAFWALVVLAVIWLVRSFRGRGTTGQRFATARFGGPRFGGPPFGGPPPYAGSPQPVASSAEQILAERFAHGQIDENEYRARLAVLRGDVRSDVYGDPRGDQGVAPPPEAPPPPV